MKRAALALATLAACSSPATGYRAGPSATTVTTTSTQPSEGAGAAGVSPDAGDRRPAPSDPTTIAPSPQVATTQQVAKLPTTTQPVATATASVSWYGAESGAHTANGDAYDPEGLTFAHRTLPFGTRVLFTGPLGSVVAVATDRGPAAWTGRDFDLSRGAFARLAPLSSGVATVTWAVVL